MARADLTPLLVSGHDVLTAVGFTFVSPGVQEPKWTDAYGKTRSASEMLTEHLWNVMGYLRAHPAWRYKYRSNFYDAARNELRKRGVL